MTILRPSRIGIVLAALITAFGLGACVETFDGLFANPCEHSITVAVHYGTEEEVRGRPEGERELIIEEELEPLSVTRIPDAFEDPGAEAFTVAIAGTDTLVEVDGRNRRGVAGGDFAVVIPASVCGSGRA